MAIEGKTEARAQKIRLGMVGGGSGAFIGGVHRMAARLDDHFELVAGALSSTAEKSLASGRELGLDPDRCYGSFEEMAEKEAARADGIEAVSIVTPNHVHYPAAKAFLERGIHVICDKPLTSNLEDAKKLKAVADNRTVRVIGSVGGVLVIVGQSVPFLIQMFGNSPIELLRFLVRALKHAPRARDPDRFLHGLGRGKIRLDCV